MLALAGVAAAAMAGGALAGGSDQMTLAFTSRTASPVVVTAFAIEQPLAPVAPFIAAGAADLSENRVDGGANAIAAPRDAGRDGVWVVSAQWVELPTGKAWQARAEVPVNRLSVAWGAYEVTVIFGPSGEMMIASDQTDATPVRRVDAARVCGARVPSADRDWRRETATFPELPAVLDYSRAHRGQVTQPPYCRQKNGGSHGS